MKKYWKDIEELENKPAKSEKERETDGFSLIDILKSKGSKSSRRDFLKAFGFSIAGAAVAASCERPVKKAIPYLIKPEEVMPGKAQFYASSFYDGEQYCSILVKTRDGRPIKIEGNELSSFSSGGTNAIVQASLLELYDDNRIKQPVFNGVKTSWQKIDEGIASQLEVMANANQKVALITSSIISPSTQNIIDEFLNQYPNVEHLAYDPVSVTGIMDANEQNFNRRFIPEYRFDKAKVIVSFEADFLGTWISPIEYATQYSGNRKLHEGQKSMSRHIQIETGMSLTGSNADERHPVKPSALQAVAAQLYNYLLQQSGFDAIETLPDTGIDIASIGKELLENKGESLVVCGSNDAETQVIINQINHLLDNYENTIITGNQLNTRKGDESGLIHLTERINRGEIKGLMVCNANPLYDFPLASQFKEALNRLDFSVCLGTHWNETALECQYICPVHHQLESWDDAHPKSGLYSLAQPAIHPIFDTRQFQESLLKWMGREQSYDAYIKAFWKKYLFPLTHEYVNFTDFWNHSLHDGIFEPKQEKESSRAFSSANQTLPSIFRKIKNEKQASGDNEIELHLYQNVQIGSGRHANNPWLQEAPDGVTRITWDNHASVSPKFAREHGLKTGDVIQIDGKTEIPVLVQPGQQYHTISVALGYGRSMSGKAAQEVGKNFYPWVKMENGRYIYYQPVTFKKTSKFHEFAMTQQHHSMEERPIIREATLREYHEDPAAGNEMHEKIKHHLETLYPDHEYPGHHWGMIVDLNACIGCNACLIACSAENNVPVVGKEEVKRAHEMHWIRLDRYYSGNPENPEVSRQPVICQHCDNAPCENVCPVAATTHSNEGINQMAYNRCIGTRYCNNNCPYKVRRFNWYDYNRADAIPNNTVDPAELSLDLPRMVLNPDVTVRAKGVMEKCTFCVQRIQEKKLNAKIDKRPLEDGEIQTACEQACPAHAIVFGDLNNKDSKVSRLMKDERNYHLLEQLHTLPSVGYLTKIRNKSSQG